MKIVAEVVKLMLGFESLKLDLHSSSYDPLNFWNSHSLDYYLFVSRFWELFSIGKKRELGQVFFIEIVAAIVNLMLGF